MVAEDKVESATTTVTVLPARARKAERNGLPEALTSVPEGSQYATFLTDLRSAVCELERLQGAIRQRQSLVGDGVEMGMAQIQTRPARLSPDALTAMEDTLAGPMLNDNSLLDGSSPGISYRLEAMYFVARRVVSDATADNLLKEVVEYAIQLGHYRFSLLAACEMRAVSNADAARGKVVEAALKEGDFAFALMSAELIENRSSADGAKGKVIKALRGAGKGSTMARIPYSGNA
jgi:hypothetical protein